MLFRNTIAAIVGWVPAPPKHEWRLCQPQADKLATRPDVLVARCAADAWGVLGASRPVHRGIRVHRTTILDRDDTTRHRGIPVTSPARTLLDLAATLDHGPLRAATRRAQSLYRVNLRQLADVLARHPRRRGSARLARIIATGPAPTRSELEDVVLDLILRGGLAHPDVNVPYYVEGRRTAHDQAGGQAITHPQRTLARLRAAGAP